MYYFVVLPLSGGLRDSEKSRPQGFARAALDTASSSRTKQTTSRFRRDSDWTPAGFNDKSGKRDITDKDTKPKSRKERFHDPTERFGKKSLVFHAKHGRLREKLDALKSRLAGADKGSFEDKFASQFKDQSTAKPPRSQFGDDRRRPGFTRPENSGSRVGYGNRRSGPDFSRKDGGRSTRAPRFARTGDQSARQFDEKSDFKSSDRGTSRFNDGPARRQGDTGSRRFDDGPTRREGDTGSRRFDDGPARRQDDTGSRRFDDRTARFSDAPRDDTLSFRSAPPSHDLPIRIHHTTAASQFLYGRSVVEAALRASRRKLYHLYLYAGRDRQNLIQDATLEKLAAQLGIQVTKVTDNDGLRMMDKMSGGRPHNGCILEASPAPQIPLKSLGELSDDPSKPSFKVELAYQSAEDAAINGTPESMPYHTRGDRKPFFLLLDGILDPGNLGAILRTAAFLGVTGVVITKHGSSGLTPVSLKASSGASEVLQLYSTNSTPDFIERSRDNGWEIYASVAAGPRSRGNSHLTIDRIETYDPLSERPTILVIGSEGEGLEKKIKRLADFEVSIPGHTGFLSTIDSLNVSVATGIMCSAFLKKNQGFEIEEATSEIKKKEGDDSHLW
ncbi:putative rRNA methyltransferase 1, mitochondrial [Seiridium cardinale]|uniref:rRNA methyltransferase 1, mitochondrial n=1 Tax=Seiridium cardinale TaxID=138064 RepID=A0ABR2XL91_9PEZI